MMRQTYAPYVSSTIEDEMIEERDRELKKVYEDFKTVNDVMKSAASLIYQQGEYVDNIATNITYAKNNTERAVSDLRKADAEDSKSITDTIKWVGIGGGVTTVIGAAVAAIILL